MPEPVAGHLFPGDVRFYDQIVPAQQSGHWFLQVSHTTAVDGGETFTAVQEFVVRGPRFAIEPTEIVGLFPPDGGCGGYANALPYIVLNRATLPWERRPAAGLDSRPWLALLVLAEDELIGGTTATGAYQTTVKDFLAGDPVGAKVIRPTLALEDPEEAGTGCAFIRIAPATFKAIVPTDQELPYLVHCRDSSQSDKAGAERDGDGLFSVVLANRFPVPAAAGKTARTVVHLVSLEGLIPYLTGALGFADDDQAIDLLSLTSWDFQCQASDGQSFRGLMAGIVQAQTRKIDTRTFDAGGDRATVDPERLRLRLPVPATLTGTDAATAEIIGRLNAGFVPLGYQTRTGEQTFAWYRGPFTPERLPPGGLPPFFSADAAIIYQPDFGTFDLSLAAAWEIGRIAALSDAGFGQSLLDFRRLLTGALDRLEDLIDHGYVDTEIETVTTAHLQSAITGQFERLLNGTLLDLISAVPVGPDPATLAAVPAVRTPNPHRDLTDFHRRPDVRTVAETLADAQLAPLLRWLTRLALLHPVPLHALVAHPEVLPDPGLRFFHLHQHWIDALLDGALSLGVESSRQTALHGLIWSRIRRAVAVAVRTFREEERGAPATGTSTAPADTPDAPISGLLLRASLVRGLPKLAVRAARTDGTLVPMLRMDRIAPSVLLCLFDGIPDQVVFSEPQEGFRFGMNAEGRLTLRCLAGAGGEAGGSLGAPLADTLTVTDGMRDGGKRRVLSLLDPNGGLVGRVIEALNRHDAATTPERARLTRIGSADLAIQLLQTPETIAFLTP